MSRAWGAAFPNMLSLLYTLITSCARVITIIIIIVNIQTCRYELIEYKVLSYGHVAPTLHSVLTRIGTPRHECTNRRDGVSGMGKGCVGIGTSCPPERNDMVIFQL